MTNAAKELLDTFDSLPEDERHEVVRAILRLAAGSDHQAPDDDDLVAAADEVFLALDREEQAR